MKSWTTILWTLKQNQTILPTELTNNLKKMEGSLKKP